MPRLREPKINVKTELACLILGIACALWRWNVFDINICKIPAPGVGIVVFPQNLGKISSNSFPVLCKLLPGPWGGRAESGVFLLSSGLKALTSGVNKKAKEEAVSQFQSQQEGKPGIHKSFLVPGPESGSRCNNCISVLLPIPS